MSAATSALCGTLCPTPAQTWQDDFLLHYKVEDTCGIGAAYVIIGHVQKLVRKQKEMGCLFLTYLHQALNFFYNIP